MSNSEKNLEDAKKFLMEFGKPIQIKPAVKPVPKAVAGFYFLDPSKIEELKIDYEMPSKIARIGAQYEGAYMEIMLDTREIGIFVADDDSRKRITELAEKYHMTISE